MEGRPQTNSKSLMLVGGCGWVGGGGGLLNIRACTDRPRSLLESLIGDPIYPRCPMQPPSHAQDARLLSAGRVVKGARVVHVASFASPSIAKRVVEAMQGVQNRPAPPPLDTWRHLGRLHRPFGRVTEGNSRINKWPKKKLREVFLHQRDEGGICGLSFRERALDHLCPTNMLFRCDG